MIVLGEGIVLGEEIVLEGGMIALERAAQGEEEVQEDTVDLDHK